MIKKVCKFGGTSLATIEQIDKALDIMLSDPSRRYMVVSAPGARYKGDPKVTNMLEAMANFYLTTGSIDSTGFDAIMRRYQEIIPDRQTIIYELMVDLRARLNDKNNLFYKENVMAFGEAGIAKVANELLRARGVDSAVFNPRDMGFRVIEKNNIVGPDVSCFGEVGKFLSTKDVAIAVIPGYFAYDAHGRLRTFPRGGSDTSGAVVARSIGAYSYENWTDKNGITEADPDVVPYAETIRRMTFEEAGEVAYMGFKLEQRSFDPLLGTNIRLQVKNTNNSSHSGTLITESRKVSSRERIIGVSCEKGAESVTMTKRHISDIVGFGNSVFGVVKDLGLPYEHASDGVNNISVIFATKNLKAKNMTIDDVVREMETATNSDRITTGQLSIVGVTGLGISKHYDTHERVFSVLKRRRIRPTMLDGGVEGLSFFFGVEQNQADSAVRGIYDEFFPKKR